MASIGVCEESNMLKVKVSLTCPSTQGRMLPLSFVVRTPHCKPLVGKIIDQRDNPALSLAKETIKITKLS